MLKIIFFINLDVFNNFYAQFKNINTNVLLLFLIKLHFFLILLFPYSNYIASFYLIGKYFFMTQYFVISPKLNSL